MGLVRPRWLDVPYQGWVCQVGVGYAASWFWVCIVKSQGHVHFVKIGCGGSDMPCIGLDMPRELWVWFVVVWIWLVVVWIWLVVVWICLAVVENSL